MLFFFFKQKTAYEMRISDWSSDVCSSDLRKPGGCRTLRVRWQDPLPGIGSAGLPAPRFRGMLAPNCSFNPNPLRCFVQTCWELFHRKLTTFVAAGRVTSSVRPHTTTHEEA